MGDDDIRERIARAIEEEHDRKRGLLDEIGPFAYFTGEDGFDPGHLRGMREAVRIARETPVAHDEPALTDRVSTAYRTLAARLWAERHGVGDLDVAFTVVDGMASEAARQPVNPRP